MSDGELRRIARKAQADGTDAALARLGREYLRAFGEQGEAFRMRIRILGSNQTELETVAHRILFSYETPVAFNVKHSERWFKSIGQPDGKKWSRTTVKHINRWIPEGETATPVAQTDIWGLLDV